MASFNCREEEKLSFDSLKLGQPLDEFEEKKTQLLQKLEEIKRTTYNFEGKYQYIVETTTNPQDETIKVLKEELENRKKILKDLQTTIEQHCATALQIQPQTFEEKKKNIEEKLSRVRIPDDSMKWCDFCLTDHINTSVPFCVACKSHHNTRENMLSTVAYLLKK